MSLPFHRLFSMPAIEGLRVARGYIHRGQEVSIEAAVLLVEKVEADATSFDLEAAIQLHPIIDSGVELSGCAFYQQCLYDIILHRQPNWAKLMTLGRERFVKKLSVDERALFRLADLLEIPPTESIIRWWDTLTGQVRFRTDQSKLVQARAAEKLTLDHEQNLIDSAGLSLKAKWTAIEDNTAGYDVLSYIRGDFGPLNKLIEVKSTIASPLRFYISRNEWENAEKYGEAYFFHVWDMKQSPPILYEKKASEIAPHIPQDNAKGKWKNVEIPLGI